MTQQATLERLVNFYQRMDSEALSGLNAIYHHDVVLCDPVGEHAGLAVMESYFRRLLKNMRYCRFIITLSRQYQQDALLLWRMEYAHPALKRGADLAIEGSSWLQFREDKIIFQRDYYDLGAMVYQHVPLLGGAIRQLNKRLR